MTFTDTRRNHPVDQEPTLLTLEETAYVEGVLSLGWPDGAWELKLPTSEVLTVDVVDGSTSSLKLFVWDVLRPGDMVEVYPARGDAPGWLWFRRPSKPSFQQPAVRQPPAEDSAEALALAVVEAVDRLVPPVFFETLWSFLSHSGIDIGPDLLSQSLGDLYDLKEDGKVHEQATDNPKEHFYPDDVRWDNVEEVYWGLNPDAEPASLEPMHRKRKSSSNDGLEQYLDEISHRLLTAEEETTLGESILRGQEAQDELRDGEEDHDRKIELGLAIRASDVSRERFATRNLRLVYSIARKRRRQVEGTAVGLDDLIQAGYIGLLRAVERFDPARSFRFSTYATWWIKQGISREIANKARTVRLPVHIHDRLQPVRQHENRLIGQLGRHPSPSEIAEKSGLTLAQVESVLDVGAIVELPEVESADGATLAEEDEGFESVVEHGVRMPLRQAVEDLGTRLATVITLRYGLDDGVPRTLETIGRDMGVTRERIRQLENKALSKLRASPIVGALGADGWTEPTHPLPTTQRTKAQQSAWAEVRRRARILGYVGND